MANTLIAHAEIPTTNLDASKDFLNKILGWEFKQFGNGYLLYNPHKGTTLGLRKVEKNQTGDTTIFHIKVESIDDILIKVTEAGGKIERTKTVIPAMGWYALIKDVDGNTLGLYETNK